MYVRLKHALSALALDALAAPPHATTRAAVGWLAAYCGLVATPAAAAAAGRPSGGRFEIPLDEVARRVGRGRAGSAGLEELITRGLLERRDGLLALPPAYQADFAYAHRQAHRLAAVLRARRAPRGGGPTDAVRRGAALFNGGLFFECHEYFEDLWRAAPAADKPFLQGVIQVAAAFYHLEKGNLHGAQAKLASGVAKLRTCPPAAHGVRIARWLAVLTPWQAAIAAGRRAGILQVPDIPAMPLDRRGAP